MNIEANTIRLLGAAQLIVFVASMLSERLLTSVVGSGSISDKLVNISKNLTRIRISNLVAPGYQPWNRCPGSPVLYRL